MEPTFEVGETDGHRFDGLRIGQIARAFLANLIERGAGVPLCFGLEGQLEELNLQAKAQRYARTPLDQIREERTRYLADTKAIKAVTVCFSDLEGRLHMLDYDKKFLLKSADNLTFDGSSIRGFSEQKESDLRLGIDWSAFYWVPADFFGPGKILVFGEVLERDGAPYTA